MTPLKEALIRDGWSLVITNIPTHMVTADKLYDIYAMRWGIEIAFRAMKQSCNIKHALNHKSSLHHIQAMVLAAMIYQLFTVRIMGHLRRQISSGIYLSIEKLSDVFSIYLLSLNRNTIYTKRFEPDVRHIRHDKRKRLTLW